MKRIILITLCVAMMFMSAAPAKAMAACGSHAFETTGEYWVPTGNGDSHTYTGRDGKTYGCRITYMRKIVVRVCNVCGTVNHVNTAVIDGWHSTDHT